VRHTHKHDSLTLKCLHNVMRSISTPQRFDKTISVCLFAAALIFACPNVEISIYSTCECKPCALHASPLCTLTLCLCAGKRISQKLLRNCVKFLSIIHDVLKIAPMEYIKQSRDEIDIRGPESKYDSRKINSNPSKVGIVCALWCFSVNFFRRFR